VPAQEKASAAGGPDWGAGDEGWRAAQALTQPVTAEVTTMGLPRRQPRALLVPGAAGVAEPKGVPPVHTAEAIRGRLASYQQGIREGRQARASIGQNASRSQPAQSVQSEQPKQQDGEEATT
jgi:hypothetical protein